MAEVSSEGCLAVLDRAGLRERVTESLLGAIQEVLTRRAGDMRIGALLFSGDMGMTGLTAGAKELMDKWRKSEERASP